MTELEQELQKYALLDSNELSEVSELLLNLSKYKPYLSEEFNAVLESEMKRLLKELPGLL